MFGLFSCFSLFTSQYFCNPAALVFFFSSASLTPEPGWSLEFIPPACSVVFQALGGKAKGTKAVFHTVSNVAAGPAPVVFCLLRLSRCFCSSAVCLLCRCVFYCFLLFCALLLLFCLFFSLPLPFFQQPSRWNRLLLCSNGFGDTSELSELIFSLPASRHAKVEPPLCLLSAAR